MQRNHDSPVFLTTLVILRTFIGALQIERNELCLACKLYIYVRVWVWKLSPVFVFVARRIWIFRPLSFSTSATADHGDLSPTGWRDELATLHEGWDLVELRDRGPQTHRLKTMSTMSFEKNDRPIFQQHPTRLFCSLWGDFLSRSDWNRSLMVSFHAVRCS